MKKINLNENFIEEYLTVGNLQFNTVLSSCPKELLDTAKQSLARNNQYAISCVVEFTREEELLVEKTLSLYDEADKKLIARDFVCSLIMSKLLFDPSKKAILNLMKTGVDCICGKSPLNPKEYHKFAPLPCDISMTAMKLGKVELTFLLENTENKFIQQVINNFLASRDRYLKIKVFTTNKFLPSCYDQMGNLVEPIHDYTLINVDHLFNDNNSDTVME